MSKKVEVTLTCGHKKKVDSCELALFPNGRTTCVKCGTLEYIRRNSF